ETRAHPHRSLHDDVEVDVILTQELENPRLWVFPEAFVFAHLSALVLQGELCEGDGGDQRVGPNVERLALHLRIDLRRNGNAPGHVAGDGSMGPAVKKRAGDPLLLEQFESDV